MVKFAHISDTHLGYRQYGLEQREEDFYNSFLNLIGDVISENPDFIIHSGDLFETNRPSNKAHFTFQKVLELLNREDIPLYAIAGNHDISLKKDSIPPQVLYTSQGLNLISPNNPYFIFNEDTFIGGIQYTSLSHKGLLKKNLEILSKKAENYKNRILVLHQGVDLFMPFNSELEIGEIPENFQYYAMGHLHNYINTNYGEGVLAYPGSSEIWKTSELGDYNKNGKGYILVDLNKELKTYRKTVKVSREFINKTIEYENLYSELQNIKNNLLRYEKPPIINITIQGDKFNTKEAYETVHQYLDEYALLVRPKYQNREDKINLERENIDTLDPRKFIHQHFKTSKYHDAGEFTLNLYDNLINKKIEDAEILVDSYYNNTFKKDSKED